MSKKKEILRPGQITPASGQYVPVNLRGEKLGREITSIAGKPLPPTQKPKQGYVLVGRTKHKK